MKNESNHFSSFLLDAIDFTHSGQASLLLLFPVPS